MLTIVLSLELRTLLNRILKEQHGKKIAVIENEFGEVGIDSSLVEQQERTTETVVEMHLGPRFHRFRWFSPWFPIILRLFVLGC